MTLAVSSLVAALRRKIDELFAPGVRSQVPMRVMQQGGKKGNCSRVGRRVIAREWLLAAKEQNGKRTSTSTMENG
jgi:hypothetical protein